MKQGERQGLGLVLGVNGELFDNLRFADAIDFLEHNCERLQQSLNSIVVVAVHASGMIRLEEEETEWVEQFVYL